MVIISATGLADCDGGGEQDPYCIVSLGNASGKTAVLRGGGTDPTWSEEEGTLSLDVDARFAAEEPRHLLKIEIYDRDHFTADDHVGVSGVWLHVLAQQCLRDGTDAWKGDVRVYSRGTVGMGKLTFEVRFKDCHLDATRELFGSDTEITSLIEATPAKSHNNLLAGVVQEMSTSGFMTYEVPLQCIAEIFGDALNYGINGQHPATFQDDAHGAAVRGALSAAHQTLYRDGAFGHDSGRRSRTTFVGSGEDFVAMISSGIRDEKRRVYTYALTDEGGFCFSETGAALSKDNMSKHAIHANGAMAVRYSGTFRICQRENGNPVLCIDNDSGTYQPNAEYHDRLKQVLELNFRGLEVIPLNVCDEQPEWMKEFIGPVEQKDDPDAVYSGKWAWKTV